MASILDRIGGAIKGGLTGFTTGGPWGAVAGGVAGGAKPSLFASGGGGGGQMAQLGSSIPLSFLGADTDTSKNPGFWDSPLGQAVLDMGLKTVEGLGQEYGPTGQSNRDLTSSYADYNRSRAALQPFEAASLGANTAATLQTTQQGAEQYELGKQRDLSLNPARKQGFQVMTDLLHGRGPAQQTLNRYRTDNRRTVPMLPGHLMGQVQRNRNGAPRLQA